MIYLRYLFFVISSTLSRFDYMFFPAKQFIFTLAPLFLL